MIQPQTRLKVADNSGAKEVQCIHILGGSKVKFAGIGDVIVASFFFTAPPGVAVLTDATMTSPIPADLTLLPPRTRMHMISLAPLLSATFNLV